MVSVLGNNSSRVSQTSGVGDSRFLLLKESVVKMGIAPRTEIENWFTVETLGVSG